MNKNSLPLIDDLDEGIRGYVEILRASGIETFESCQGGKGHSFPEATIRFHGEYGEGFRAYSVARDHALPVTALRRAYSVEDGELKGPWWEMVFLLKQDDPYDYMGAARCNSPLESKQETDGR